jgi:hypothetical protein
MSPADDLFARALARLQADYADFVFFVERDVVWTLQTWLRREIDESGSPLRLFNDYPILPGKRRGLSTDLAILDGDAVDLAVEIKYEPSHSRADIPQGKLPVVFWGVEGVAKDIARIRDFVSIGPARRAISLFIDEGGAFRHRPPQPGSRWIDWQVAGPPWMRPSLLWSEAQRAPS